MRLVIASIMTVALAAMATPAALAETYVSGEILLDTTWTIGGSPYIVTGTVVVRDEAILTIDPGVEVRFWQDQQLQLGSNNGSVTDSGELYAVGESGSPILFTSDLDPPQPGDWAGIWFANNAVDGERDGSLEYVDGSIISEAIVEYAGGSGGIYVTYSSPYLESVEVRDCNNSGIYVSGNTSTPGIYIHDCHVHDCTTDNSGGGIHVGGHAAHLILGNLVEYCSANRGGGVWIGSSDNANVGSNTVRYNSANSGGGVAAETNQYLTLARNSVHHNTADNGGGEYVSQSHFTTFGWEYMVENTANADGGALYLVHSNDCQLTNCHIRDNYVGSGSTGGVLVTNSAEVNSGCMRTSLAGDPDYFLNWSNNIAGNDGYQLRNANPDDGSGDYDIDATYVVWCTSDPSDLICDIEDEPGCAAVIWDPVAPFLGDLDSNGAVDLMDLAQLLAHYGTSEGALYEDGDLDLDGDVDLADLAALLGQYGKLCEDS